jgi:hypothetical protein
MQSRRDKLLPVAKQLDFSRGCFYDPLCESAFAAKRK